MNNIITGTLSTLLFLVFVGGLAHSIGAFPFTVIVAIVGLMLVIDLIQTIISEIKGE